MFLIKTKNRVIMREVHSIFFIHNPDLVKSKPSRFFHLIVMNRNLEEKLNCDIKETKEHNWPTNQVRVFPSLT